jgi:uncharacterized protein YfaS (alpha-2-macroglobulin family)
VVRALVDFSKASEELTPNYTYSVALDGKQIAQGTVTGSKQTIKEIDIPVANIKSGGSNVVIKKSGNGQIYSTLIMDEFHTDKNAKSVNHGLSVKREYVNEKGPEYTLGVGDTVVVKITVGGLQAAENYGVIRDELPSGLIPVNESFKNEQYGQSRDTYYTSYDITDREVTENGMVLSLYQIAQGVRTYTYRARVISAGTFIAPPATASLMYAPEIYGRSDVETIKISKESRFVGKKDVTNILGKKGVSVGTGVLILIIVIAFLVLKRSINDYIKRLLRRDSPEPPTKKPTSLDNDQDEQ